MPWETFYQEQVHLAKKYLKVRWTPELAARFYLICAWHWAKEHKWMHFG